MNAPRCNPIYIQALEELDIDTQEQFAESRALLLTLNRIVYPDMIRMDIGLCAQLKLCNLNVRTRIDILEAWKYYSGNYTYCVSGYDTYAINIRCGTLYVGEQGRLRKHLLKHIAKKLSILLLPDHPYLEPLTKLRIRNIPK